MVNCATTLVCIADPDWSGNSIAVIWTLNAVIGILSLLHLLLLAFDSDIGTMRLISLQSILVSIWILLPVGNWRLWQIQKSVSVLTT
jgi:hypothetical protein